jgi:hypothetical protein
MKRLKTVKKVSASCLGFGGLTARMFLLSGYRERGKTVGRG